MTTTTSIPFMQSFCVFSLQFFLEIIWMGCAHKKHQMLISVWFLCLSGFTLGWAPTEMWWLSLYLFMDLVSDTGPDPGELEDELDPISDLTVLHPERLRLCLCMARHPRPRLFPAPPLHILTLISHTVKHPAWATCSIF